MDSTLKKAYSLLTKLQDKYGFQSKKCPRTGETLKTKEKEESENVDWCLVDEDGRKVKLPKTMLFIGCEECDILVESDGVDKRHAVVTFDHYHNKFKIKDLSTSNGTFVNNCKIPDQEYVILEHTDSIHLGCDSNMYHMERADDDSDIETIHPIVQRPECLPSWASREVNQMAECQGCIAEQKIKHTCESEAHSNQSQDQSSQECFDSKSDSQPDVPLGSNTWPRNRHKERIHAAEIFSEKSKKNVEEDTKTEENYKKDIQQQQQHTPHHHHHHACICGQPVVVHGQAVSDVPQVVHRHAYQVGEVQHDRHSYPIADTAMHRHGQVITDMPAVVPRTYGRSISEMPPIVHSQPSATSYDITQPVYGHHVCEQIVNYHSHAVCDIPGCIHGQPVSQPFVHTQCCSVPQMIPQYSSGHQVSQFSSSHAIPSGFPVTLHSQGPSVYYANTSDYNEMFQNGSHVKEELLKICDHEDIPDVSQHSTSIKDELDSTFQNLSPDTQNNNKELGKAQKGTPLYGQPDWWGEETNEKRSSSPHEEKLSADQTDVKPADKPESLPLNGDSDVVDMEKYKTDPKYNITYMEIPHSDVIPEPEKSDIHLQRIPNSMSQDSLSGELTKSSDSPVDKAIEEKKDEEKKSPDEQTPPEAVSGSSMAFTIAFDESPEKHDRSLSELLPQKIRKSFRGRSEKMKAKTTAENVHSKANGSASPETQRKIDDLWNADDPLSAEKTSTSKQSKNHVQKNEIHEELDSAVDVPSKSPRSTKPTLGSASKVKCQDSNNLSGKHTVDSKKLNRSANITRRPRKIDKNFKNKHSSEQAAYLIDKMFEKDSEEIEVVEQNLERFTEHALYTEAKLYDTSQMTPSESSENLKVPIVQNGRKYCHSESDVSEAGTYTIESEIISEEEDDEDARLSIDEIFGVTQDGEMLIPIPVIRDDKKKKKNRELKTNSFDMLNISSLREVTGKSAELRTSSMEAEAGSEFINTELRIEEDIDTQNLLSEDVAKDMISQHRINMRDIRRSLDLDSNSDVSFSESVSSGKQAVVRKRPGTGRRLPSIPNSSGASPPYSDTSSRTNERSPNLRDVTSPKSSDLFNDSKQKNVKISSQVTAKYEGTDTESVSRTKLDSDSNYICDSPSSLYIDTESFMSPRTTGKKSSPKPTSGRRPGSVRSTGSLDTEVLLKDTESVMAAMEARMVSQTKHRTRQSRHEVKNDYDDDSSVVAMVNGDETYRKPSKYESPRHALASQKSRDQRGSTKTPTRTKDISASKSSYGKLERTLSTDLKSKEIRQSKSPHSNLDRTLSSSSDLSKSRHGHEKPERHAKEKSDLHRKEKVEHHKQDKVTLRSNRNRLEKQSSLGSDRRRSGSSVTSLISDVMSDLDRVETLSNRSESTHSVADSLEDGSFNRQGSKGKGKMSMTRPNRAFQLRRARADGEGTDGGRSSVSSVSTASVRPSRSNASSTNKTPYRRSKSLTRTTSAGLSLAPSSGRSEVSLGAEIVQKSRENSKSSKKDSSGKLSRTDGGRHSLRSEKGSKGSTSNVSTPSTASTRKSEIKALKSQLKSSQNSGYGLSVSSVKQKSTSQPNSRSNSPKTQAWKRRKGYDPRKSVADAKAKAKEIAKSKQTSASRSQTKEQNSISHSTSFTGSIDFEQTKHNETFSCDSGGSLEDLSTLGYSATPSEGTGYTQNGHSFIPVNKSYSSLMTQSAGEEELHDLRSMKSSQGRSYSMLNSVCYKSAFTPPPTKSSTLKYNSLALYRRRSEDTVTHDGSSSFLERDQSYDNLIISSIHQLSQKLNSATDRIYKSLKNNRGNTSSPSPIDDLLNQPSSGDIPHWKSANQELASILYNLRNIENHINVIDRVVTGETDDDLETPRVSGREKENYLQEIERIRGELAGFQPIEKPRQCKSAPEEPAESDCEELGGEEFY